MQKVKTKATPKGLQPTTSLHQGPQPTTAPHLVSHTDLINSGDIAQGAQPTTSIHQVSLTNKLLKLGDRLYRNGKYEDAIKRYEKAIEINTNCASAYNSIGNAKLALGRTGDAIDSYEEAIIRKPNNALYHFHKGNALKILGKTAETLDCFKKACEIIDKNPYHHDPLWIKAREEIQNDPLWIKAREKSQQFQQNMPELKQDQGQETASTQGTFSVESKEEAPELKQPQNDLPVAVPSSAQPKIDIVPPLSSQQAAHSGEVTIVMSIAQVKIDLTHHITHIQERGTTTPGAQFSHSLEANSPVLPVILEGGHNQIATSQTAITTLIEVTAPSLEAVTFSNQLVTSPIQVARKVIPTQEQGAITPDEAQTPSPEAATLTMPRSPAATFIQGPVIILDKVPAIKFDDEKGAMISDDDDNFLTVSPASGMTVRIAETVTTVLYEEQTPSPKTPLSISPVPSPIMAPVSSPTPDELQDPISETVIHPANF